MAQEWMKIGVDVGVGAAAGVVDQLVLNRDEKEEDRRHRLVATDKAFLPANKKLPIISRFGTFYNFGVPILALAGVVTGYLKGDNATKALIVGGQLAGREGTQLATTKPRPIVTAPAAWQVYERAAKGGGGGAAYTVTNPSGILV